MNIIDLLGITYKEDVISNFLVGLINESKRFAVSFLENIIGINNAGLYNVKAFTRISTSQGVPDIVIKVHNEYEDILVVIENKLKAEEGYEQTARYCSDECIKDICSKKEINLDYKSITTKFIYLTLVPEQVPSGEKFVNRLYRDLLSKVNVDIENDLLDKVYKDFMKVIKDFYSNLTINQDDKILDLLCDNDDEKVYIRFKSIVKLFNFTNQLKVIYVGKTHGAGHTSFIAQISKDNWKGNSKAELKNSFYNINEDTYNIHLEFSLDIFNKVIKLPLHYETNPYIPKGKLIKSLRKEDYEKYINRRDLLKNKLHEKINVLGDKNIKPYNGRNQIAYINIKVDNNTTVKKFTEIVEEYCNIIAAIVDEALEGVNI